MSKRWIVFMILVAVLIFLFPPPSCRTESCYHMKTANSDIDYITFRMAGRTFCIPRPVVRV
jgi:hypothetical protein